MPATLNPRICEFMFGSFQSYSKAAATERERQLRWKFLIIENAVTRRIACLLANALGVSYIVWAGSFAALAMTREMKAALPSV
jgi:hypothetical protein